MLLHCDILATKTHYDYNSYTSDILAFHFILSLMVYFNNQKQNDSVQSHVLSHELRHEHKENVPEIT